MFSNNSTAILMTDRPELAAYAELYNAETEGRKIEVVYREIPWLALETKAGSPDLVAGESLSSTYAVNNFESLDRLIRNGKLNAAQFYSGLLDMGRVAGKSYLIPVSFSLPAIIFKTDFSETMPDDYIITYEDMRRLSGEFNIIDERPTRMGYSPRWQPDFMYTLSGLFGASYAESGKSVPVWNEAKVRETVNYAIDWIETTNGGWESENAFQAKYMYDPLYKLLDTRRILFNYLGIDRYLSIPAEVRETLDFRWLSDGEKIVVDKVLFLGVPKRSKHKKTARDFLLWLFDYQTQVKLLESAQFRRMRFFGIAGGFSSITSVNTDALPRFFPFVLGHIPHGGYLGFPDRLPASWELMRTEVVAPWFAAAASETGTESDLASQLSQWRLRQPELYR